MSSELEYDLSDALAYIRARVRENQQEYDQLVAGSTQDHDSIDSGSLYSQYSTSMLALSRNASVCSSHSARSQNAPERAYEGTVAGLHAWTFPDYPQQQLRDEEATLPELLTHSGSSPVRSENTPAISTSTPYKPQRKFSFEYENKPEEICTPAQHTGPQSCSSTVMKAVRFEEHDAGPLPTTTKAEEQQPLRNSSDLCNLSEGTRTVTSRRRTFSLRRTKSTGHLSASSIRSVPASGPSRTDSVLQRDRTDTA